VFLRERRPKAQQRPLVAAHKGSLAFKMDSLLGALAQIKPALPPYAVSNDVIKKATLDEVP